MTTNTLLPDQIILENGTIYLLDIGYLVPDKIVSIYLESECLSINQIDLYRIQLYKGTYGSRDNMKLLAKRISFLISESKLHNTLIDLPEELK